MSCRQFILSVFLAGWSFDYYITYVYVYATITRPKLSGEWVKDHAFVPELRILVNLWLEDPE